MGVVDEAYNKYVAKPAGQAASGASSAASSFGGKAAAGFYNAAHSNAGKFISSPTGRAIIGTAVGGPLGGVLGYASKKEGRDNISAAANKIIGGGGSSPSPAHTPDSDQPQLAAFQSRIDPNTGMLKSQYQMNSSSAWLNPQLQKQQAAQVQQGNNAATQAATGNVQAMNQLAMRGGLSSGAAERLGSDSARNLNAARQNVGFQGNQARLGIEAQGADMARQDQQYNQNATAQDMAGMNAYNQNKYNEQMKAYGAGKTADAIAQGGNAAQGGLLGKIFGG